VNTKIKLDLGEVARQASAVLKNRNSYERLIRGTQWTKGPLIVLGTGDSIVAGIAGARAFEWLLGWQVTVREAVEFEAYTLPALRPRSITIAISPSGEDERLLEILRKVRQRGATVLAVTRNRESSLASMAKGVFLLPCALPAAGTAFMQHALLLYMGCIAANVFNPRHPLAGKWEQEFEDLPDRLAWMGACLGDAVGSAAPAVGQARQTVITAGGLYHPSALQAARIAWQVRDHCTQVSAPYDLLDGGQEGLGEPDVVLILSGSNCRIKRTLHSVAGRLREHKVRIFSVTDGNDRQLVQSSELAILLPVLSEVAGSLLELALLQWLLAEA
jgi:D-arabinose 5-phosphate isomerase GutQ